MPAKNEEPIDIFLSYSRTDWEAANKLRKLLKVELVRVFKDDESIHSGDDWLAKLELAVATCGAFVVLVGAQGVRRWVFAEVKVALVRHISPHDDAKRLPIHPILLGETPPEALPPFLAAFQAERWSPGLALPAGLTAALRARQPSFAKHVHVEGCPFMGLASFGSQQAHLYFGRRQETLDALAGLGAQQERNPERAHTSNVYLRWLQVEGHSGSGKSSLVHAGLRPMVERGALWARTGFEHWLLLGPLMPGKRPVERLAEAVEQLQRPDAGRQLMQRSEDFMSDARALALHLRGHKRPGTAWLLVVDQFEELYTLADEAQRIAFDALLAHALQDADCPLFLVNTVRSDFAHRITEGLPQLAALINGHCKRFLLPQITPAGLKEVIEMPAQLADVDVSQVSAAMRGDAEDEPGALPLVENALRVLWHEADGERTVGGQRVLSGQTYRDRGGLVGMLAAEADALLERCEREHKGGHTAALELLLRLTHYSPDGRHTRQRISREVAIVAAGAGNHRLGETVLRLLAGARDPNRPSDAPAETLRLIVISADAGSADAAAVAPNRQVGHGVAPERPADHVDLIHETLLRRRPRAPRAALAPGMPRAVQAPAQGYWDTLLSYVEKHRDRPALHQQLALQIDRHERAGRLTRWFHLAGWGQLLDYRRLRVVPASPEGRFLASSRWLVATQGLAVGAMLMWGTVVWSDKARDVAAMLANSAAYLAVLPVWYLEDMPTQPELVELPALPAGASFEMGCKPGRDVDVDDKCPLDEPRRPVPMPTPCAMGKTEVTNLQFNRYVWEIKGKGVSPLWHYPANGIFGTPGRPVVNVSWHNAQNYAKWLKDKTGQPYRLPTEEEWEYAARLGSQPQADDASGPGRYPWGDEDPSGRANCRGCGDNYSGNRTAPVASYPAVAGLDDMAGNVSEWTDSADKEGSALRVLRGGSWAGDARGLRAAFRNHDHPNFASTDDIGFRVCRASPIEPLPAGAPDAGPPGR